MEDVGRAKRNRRTSRRHDRLLRDAEQRVEADAEGADISLAGVSGYEYGKEYECQNMGREAHTISHEESDDNIPVLLSRAQSSS
jgi:hypothetical protein